MYRAIGELMDNEDNERLAELELDEPVEKLSDESEDLVAIREEILSRGSFLIDEVLEGFLQTGYGRDELFHAGYLGLLSSVYDHDLARGNDFGNYARNLINGEIRQHICENAAGPETPQWLGDLNCQPEAANKALSEEHSCLPSISELAEEVNITEKGIAEIFRAREALNQVSLDEERRERDPICTVDIEKIRNKHPDVFPLGCRIRIANASEKLSDLQHQLFQTLFPLSDS